MKPVHVVLTAALLAAATPAAAQDVPEITPENVAEQIGPLLAQLHEKLRPLADAVGIEFPDLTARLDPLIRAAVPPPPPPEVKNWAFGMNFNNTSTISDAEGGPEGRKPVFDDAGDCLAAYPDDGVVVHFRRIRVGGMRGHQCVFARYDGDMGGLRSRTYAEGIDRFVVAEYDAAATVEDDAQGVRDLTEPVVETNVALAVALADLAVDAGIKDVLRSRED